jgi:NitT/TauT family transport system substrate-binding protein
VVEGQGVGRLPDASPNLAQLTANSLQRKSPLNDLLPQIWAKLWGPQKCAFLLAAKAERVALGHWHPPVMPHPPRPESAVERQQGFRLQRENDRMNALSRIAVGALALLGTAAPALAADLDKVSFGTNWLAEAEHGGFYQAVADGTYKKYGLDVTIVQGGPQSPNMQLLVAGKVDFYMGGTLGAFDAVKNDIPLIDVAAIFQKDPQIFMTHPDAGYNTFADLAKAPTIFMGKDIFAVDFAWMKATFPGFNDSQYKPYTFNPAPFIADAKSAQQGYITSEPYAVKQAAGWEPKIFLLADAGYSPYSTTIETTQDVVKTKPDVVQRFVDATIIGWYNYLYGDNKAANDLIKKDNPDMTDDQIAYSIKALKDNGIVLSGDATTKGIGCMTDARYKEFFDKLTAIKIEDSSLDYKKAYTNQFVCKGVGMNLIPKG